MHGNISKLLHITPGFRPFILLTLTLIIAIPVRLYYILWHPALPVDPDIDSYLTIAATQSGWNTLFREPLYIWALQIVKFFGAPLTILTAQFTALAMSLGAISTLYVLCWKRFNLVAAVIASLLYACTPYIAQLAARGLREDAIVFTSLLFIHLAWNHWNGHASWKSLTVLGLSGAACALLRVSSLSLAILLVIVVAAYRFWQGSRGWKSNLRWLYPISLILLLTTPYLLHCKTQYGQAFFIANYGARYYANQEFAGILPGFPSREEIQRDAYIGPVITPREYIFNYHTLPEIARRSAIGFLKVFLGFLPRVQNYFTSHIPIAILFLALHLTGILWLLHPRRLFFPLALFLFHFPLFFLAGFPFFDPRLLILGLVFILVSISCAIALLLSRLIHIRPSPPPPSPAKL